jgi:hypothetical protein
MAILIAVMALAYSASARPPAQFSISTPAGDSASAPLAMEAETSRKVIEQFFRRPYVDPVRVTIVSNRKDFDAAMPAAWGITPSQCWMVGVGVYDRLIMLSPSAWGRDACDHRPDDVNEAKTVLRHELTHVIHGQYNPTRDFTGMDEAGWFVEGLATYVSGQLDDKRLARARETLNAGHGPDKLADAWSGKEKYGVAGSMVAYLDQTYGREKLVVLLDETSTAGILKELGTTEPEFLEGWSEWLKSRKSRPVPQ